MKFEAKNLSPVAFHALMHVQKSVSIQCFDWSKMAAEGFPVARIDEYAKPCEPAIHVLRSVASLWQLHLHDVTLKLLIKLCSRLRLRPRQRSASPPFAFLTDTTLP